MRRATKITIGSGAILLAAAAAGAAAYRWKAKGTLVHTASVGQKNLASIVTANGTVQARIKVDLSANIMGQITRLNVKEGEAVRKGDLLLVIDQARYASAVDARRSAFEALEADLARQQEAAAQAKRDLGRAEAQFREEILPAAEYDRIRSQYDQAVAAVRSVEREVSRARADLASTRDELVKTEIRSPIDGVVTRRNVEEGEMVVTGTMNNPGTILMTISDMSTIEAALEVDQTDVPQLKIGQSARVLIDAFPDTPFPGVVSEIASSPIQGASKLGGAATGTDYEVKVTLLSHPDHIRPGLTVTADITTATKKGVTTVPIGALVLRQQDDASRHPPPSRDRSADGQPESVASRTRDVEGVYVVEGGTVRFQPISTGIKGELDVEVAGGLKTGEQVVTGPFKALRELKPGSGIIVDNRENTELEM